MDKNLEQIAAELFGKIRTQFPSIKLRDADNEPTDNHKEARFFEFDYERNGNSLGTVTISIDDNPDGENDGLVVMYSNDIVENQSEFFKKRWFRFLESLSDFASQRMMDFNIRDITKSNLDKRDRDQLVNNSRGEGAMTESKLWGTSKTSFQKMGEATLIVKHTKPVNYSLPAGRTMHIGSIYVENSEGERFKYPFKHLNGARALATHVAHGGTSYDSIGQHIIGLSEELNKLRMFKNYVERNEIVSEAMGSINTKVHERIDSVKKEILGLQNPNYYQSFVESFTDNDDVLIPEDIVNDWIDRLTIRTFNEELKNVFPYIYKLVGEEVAPVKELSLDDLLGEEVEDEEELATENFNELDTYEQFINGIDEESALLNVEDSQAEAITKLNDLMQSEMPLGTDGTNAIQSLDGIIDDPELVEALKELAQVNPEMDSRDIIKSYLDKYDEEQGTDISSKISYTPSTEPAAPAEPEAAAPEAAPEQPVSENLVKVLNKVINAGATLETRFRLGGEELSLGEAMTKFGLNPNKFFIESKGSEEVVEFIKSMFDENTGQFPKGVEGVKIAVEKEFGEGAAPIAERVIAELAQVFESISIFKLAGLKEQQMPAMMDPNAMMQQQMGQIMQRNPKLQNIDPAKMSANLNQRVQQMKAQQANMPAGQDNYTVNGKPVTKAEYDAFMAKNPQLSQNMQNPMNVVKGNPELARIKKMAGMPSDDWEESSNNSSGIRNFVTSEPSANVAQDSSNVSKKMPPPGSQDTKNVVKKNAPGLNPKPAFGYDTKDLTKGF